MDKRKRERHGMSRTPTYHSWAMMNQRCLNDKTERFENYGGRSITVCERWQNSFLAFLEDMGEKPEGMSIDRIDNDGNYCPENCRWATPKEQANNKRDTRRVVDDGEVRLARDVAKENGISWFALQSRVQKGWSLEEATGLVEHYDPRAITIEGETMTMAQWAKKAGISRQAVHIRLKSGWSIKDALTVSKEEGAQRQKMLRGPRVKKRISLLGDFITSERVKRGLTQRQLAECSGLNASTISSIELGNLANPAWHIVEQLADALDMKTKNLMRLLPERKAVQMSNDDGERITWLQVRMSEDEKALLSDLAGEYGVSISALVRMMIVHVYEKRPSFVVRSVIAPRGKGFALASMSA